MANTYNPITGKEGIPRFRLFQQRPAPEPGVALVLCREGQPLVTLWPEDRLTAGEAMWGNYSSAHRVDVTEHSFTFDCTLPCESDAFDFQAEVHLTCYVDDPAVVVERNVSDARGVLEPLIVRTMRSISRDYDVQEIAAAEKAITQAVSAESYDVGFVLSRFVVELSLEEEARYHIREQIEWHKERERKEAELASQRDALEMERRRMKIDFYGPLIRGGHWELLALQLTNNPEDVRSVAQMLDEERGAQMEQQLVALRIMLEEDAVEGFQLQVKDAGKRVLRRFVDMFGLDLETPALEQGEDLERLSEKTGDEERTESEGG